MAGTASASRSRSSLLLAPALVWLALLFVIPCLLVLALGFFRRGIYGGIEYVFTLENFGLLLDPLYLGVFLTSARIALTVTVLAVVLGYAAASAIAAAPPRARSVLLFLTILPTWSNYLIRTYAWIVLLNREGLVAHAARKLGFQGDLPQLLYTEGAVIAGLLCNYLPFVILACYAPIAQLDRSMVEASHDLGASRTRTFWRVTLPLTLPGIAAGAVFIFVLSIGNFITPALLGGGQFQMIGNLVSSQFLAANDWPLGSAMATVLILLMLGLLTLQAMLADRGAGWERADG